MNNLVEIRNNQVVVSSRQVAEKFEKEHRHVLENIRQILAAENSAAKFFSESTFQNRGKEYPEYLMNRDGFTLLAMGFTGKDALQWKMKYIAAFNEMEERLEGKVLMLPDFTNPAEAARAWAEQFDKRKDAEGQVKALEVENTIQKQLIAEFQPVKEYVDTILQSEDTVTVTQIAADYGLSAKALNKILHDRGLIRKVGGQWILYKNYMEKGYTKSETIDVTRKDGSTKTVMQTKWTQKGRLKIHELLTSMGYQANMDKEKTSTVGK